MAQGVEGLQLLYGIDDAPEDGSANRFMTAAEVDAAALWQSVVSVRLELLLRSEDANLVPTAQTYNYNEAATTAPDTRLYRVYTTTINLRNRTP
jgi:type IV pilus assembly protein PilW